MVVFVESPDDFGVVVGGCVGAFLTREGDDDSGVVVAVRGKLVVAVFSGDFDFCPFSPEVDAGGGFDHFGDVGSADARRCFEKIETPVVAAADEFGVGDAANESERVEELAIEGGERLRFG